MRNYELLITNHELIIGVMKKAFSLIAMLVVALTASAQRDAGTFSLTPKVGVSLAELTKSDLAIAGYGELNPKFKPGFTAGLEGEYQVSDIFSLSAGVLYTTRGCRYNDVDVKRSETDEQAIYDSYNKVKTTLGYIDIPLMANVYVAKGLAVKAGLQLGVMTNAKTQMDINEMIFDKQKQEYSFGERRTDKSTGTDGYNSVDVSIPVGLSYEYMNVVIDARYYFTLNKTSKTDDARNRAFTFTVGYKFDI